MNESIRKLIDSCRPQGDDLGQPEMQPLADLIANDEGAARQLVRSRQLDDTITAAVHNVPTPAGLEQRLLTALADSAAVATEIPSTSSGESTLVEEPPPSRGKGDESVVVLSSKSGFSRSRRLWMLVATCAAVTVVIAFFVNSFPGPTITDDELASAALSWKVGATGWKQGNFVWTRYPLPKAIRATKVLQRKLYTIPQYKATARCYDLKLKRGGTARVYVFKATPSFELPAAPPAHQVFTRGKCVAAWISGGLVYVLVVDSLEEYEDAIRPPSQLTLRWPVEGNFCPIGTV